MEAWYKLARWQGSPMACCVRRSHPPGKCPQSFCRGRSCTRPGGAALHGHQSQIGEWERHKIISFSLEIKRSILPSAGMCTYANKTMHDSGLHLYLGGKNAVTQMLGVNNKSLSMGTRGHSILSAELSRKEPETLLQ